jgi:hypothetical protein
MAADKVLLAKVKKLRYLFIFTGDIAKTTENELGWRSLRGVEKDKTGGSPSYERVLAGVALWRMNPELVLVPSGGATNLLVPSVGAGDLGATDESPTIASVVSLELQSLGVPLPSIVEEPKAFNTQQQVRECADLAELLGWKPEEIGILAPIFQIPRITAMIANMDHTHPFHVGTTTLISMERVLASEDAEKWNAYFKDLYARPEMVATLIGEAIGTGQLWAGHSPKYPRPFSGFKDPLAH